MLALLPWQQEEEEAEAGRRGREQDVDAASQLWGVSESFIRLCVC